MSLIKVLVIFLWLLTSTISLMDVIEEVSNIKHKIDKLLVFIIFLVGGPIFSLNTILEYLLDLLIPEGNDDDKTGG